MRWTLLLLALLTALPAAAQDGRRWFVVAHATPQGPQFLGPYSSLDRCETALGHVLRQNREFVERERQSEGRETIYVMNLRRQLAAFESSTICELR